MSWTCQIKVVQKNNNKSWWSEKLGKTSAKPNNLPSYLTIPPSYLTSNMLPDNTSGCQVLSLPDNTPHKVVIKIIGNKEKEITICLANSTPPSQ